MQLIILSQAFRSMHFLFEIEKTKNCFNYIVLDDLSVFWHSIELEYETEVGSVGKCKYGLSRKKWQKNVQIWN